MNIICASDAERISAPHGFAGTCSVLNRVLFCLIVLIAPLCSGQEASSRDRVETFPIGNAYGWGMAFDGSNLWVTDITGGTITKLRARDGTILGVFPDGGESYNAAFDGANIWVTNYNADTLTKLRASDGALLQTFNTGDYPRGVLFDGTNIWVTNWGDDTPENPSYVTKRNPADGTVLGTFRLGGAPNNLVFDGANIWVAQLGYEGDSITELRATDLAFLGTFPAVSPSGIDFDGANIWASDDSGNSATKLRASDGHRLGRFKVSPIAYGLCYGAGYVWVTNSLEQTVQKLRLDGRIVHTYPTDGPRYSALFDGTSIWFAGPGAMTKITAIR